MNDYWLPDNDVREAIIVVNDNNNGIVWWLLCYDFVEELKCSENVWEFLVLKQLGLNQTGMLEGML